MIPYIEDEPAPSNITDEDRTRAIVAAVARCAAALGFPSDASQITPEYLDGLMAFAVAAEGVIDERQYAALWFIRHKVLAGGGIVNG
jgi:hypothetical protein